MAKNGRPYTGPGGGLSKVTGDPIKPVIRRSCSCCAEAIDIFRRLADNSYVGALRPEPASRLSGWV
jgi:hypothetical protein